MKSLLITILGAIALAFLAHATSTDAKPSIIIWADDAGT